MTTQQELFGKRDVALHKHLAATRARTEAHEALRLANLAFEQSEWTAADEPTRGHWARREGLAHLAEAAWFDYDDADKEYQATWAEFLALDKEYSGK